MTGEQYLNSLRYLDMEITALDTSRVRMEGRRQDLLEKAASFGANLSGNRVQHAISSRTEVIGVQLADLITPQELVAKLNQYQRRINQRIDKLVALKTQAQELIAQVPDARYRTLLTHRYLENLKWSTVADLMGYTEHWVRITLRVQALDAFSVVFENNHHKTPIF